MSAIKDYYSKKNVSSYRADLYYHNLTEVMNQILRKRIVRKFFSKYVKPRARVLDLGCGDANDIFNLCERYGGVVDKFVGVDIGKQLIKYLNDLKVDKCEFILGDIEKIKLGEKFDIILSLEVAEHLEKFDNYLQVIKNHLSSEGVLILSTPNDKYFFKDVYRFLKCFLRKGVKSVEKPKNETEFEEHINVMSYSKLKQILEKNGFRIIEKRRTMFIFGGTYAEPLYGVVAFINQLLPKNIMYFGSGFVVVAKLV